MRKEIKRLEEYIARLESEYEQALQTEGELQIAYREGVINGVRRVIEELENMEDKGYGK